EIAAAFAASMAVGLLLGRPIVLWLTKIGVKQTVSADAPASHAAKQGTPTMGGIVIIVALAIPIIGAAMIKGNQSRSLILLGLTIAFAGIGFWDDYLIVRRGKNLGLKARQKLALQLVFGAIFMAWVHWDAMPGRTTVLMIGSGQIDLGWLYYPLALLLIVGMSNAVNFTDGLDGLASGVSGLIALALAISCFAMGSYGWLHTFGAAIAGACAAFLWFNWRPAEVFMGDTGSLALGAALSGIAILGKVEVLFLLFAVIPIAEMVSVLLQVSVFQMRKRSRGIEYARANRLFRRTPLHHHFEELDMPETRIVGRFCLATAGSIALAMAIWRF
ncbi:MAG: phospho-N-acetylmuramoyl-pentapeptide-transferase, partial [Chthonomonadales bacterium]